MRAVSLLLIASVVLPSAGQAQRNNELKQGVQVAVTETYGATMKGRVVAVTSDSVTIASERGASFTTVARRDVRSLKVRHVSHMRGFLVGALIGMATGVVSGAVIGGSDDSCSFISCGRTENAVFGAAYLGTLGLGAGSIIGAAAGWPEWKAVR